MKKLKAMGTAVVTGAFAGIGGIYAEPLAKWGYNVTIIARDENRLSGVAKRISAATGQTVVLKADGDSTPPRA